ncbi:EscU/YscU/HrcU family type III secretion system export apparatus switch protein [Sulfurospirillum sp. 1612]|uniref:EscU/YscU/HrcU family type III secretion system export apparatus switch protein n=1 Tax=Sulfurospirillum sp. 1612 TaxID=3094835 RepID=UPI002F95C4B6
MPKDIQKAVALKYNKDKDKAPRIKAKGKGDVAKNIIKIAKECQLPIKKDEDLVELLSKVEIDQEIPQNLYKAVAEVFQFIYTLTKK